MNEAQTRPLTRLPAEQQAEVWQEAVETAPAGKVTADHVKKTVNRRKGTPADEPKGKRPKRPAPEPRHPSRQRVQDGLFEVLSMVDDANAWGLLGIMWKCLSHYGEALINDPAEADQAQRFAQALVPLWPLIEEHLAAT